MTISQKDSETNKKIMFVGVPIIGILLNYIFGNQEIEYFSIENIVSVFVSIIATAVNWIGCKMIVIFLWNKYPWHIKPLKHVLIEFVLITGLTVNLMWIISFVFSLFYEPYFSYGEFWSSTFIVVIISLFLTALHEVLFFYRQWKEHFNKSLILEKANIKAEYDSLKNQINPHFLFNSLNTLITYVEENEQATKYIHNLSDFLRYTLDNKNTDIKLLKDELNLVSKYVFLQKSRFKDNLVVKVNISEKYYNYTILPMTLQMLVDNAIKHNVISKAKPLNVNVFIENDTYIVVENNLQRRYDSPSTNQGLQNISSRYSFISEKEIVILENSDKFIVKIPLVKNEI